MGWVGEEWVGAAMGSQAGERRGALWALSSSALLSFPLPSPPGTGSAAAEAQTLQGEVPNCRSTDPSPAVTATQEAEHTARACAEVGIRGPH